MTLRAFCKKIGWPYEEFMELPWSVATEILALYDLEFKLLSTVGTKQ